MLLLMSCYKVSAPKIKVYSVSQFENDTFDFFASLHDIDHQEIAKGLINGEISLNDYPESHFTILRFYSIEAKEFNSISFCLNADRKDGKISLGLYQIRESENCLNVQADPLFAVSNLLEAKISFKLDKWEGLEANILEINGEEKQSSINSFRVRFPLFNLPIKWIDFFSTKRNALWASQEIGASSLSIKPYPGIWFSLVQSFQTTKKVAKAEAIYQTVDESLIKCHEVDDECFSLMENNCLQCRYGYSEIFDKECDRGGTKFCGQIVCGGKRQIACYRGRAHESDPDLIGCQKNSKEAFCSEGLQITCEDGKLVCL